MDIKDPEYWRKSARAHAKTISRILWTGFMLAVTVECLRLTGKTSVRVQDVEVPLDLTWFIFGAFTVTHAVGTFEFVKSARRFWELTEPKIYSRLFVDITTEDGYFMRNMTPRILPTTGGPAPMRYELSTLLAYVAVIALFFAMIPSKGFMSYQAIPAYIFTCANWIIGSRWAITLSELAVRKEYSTILSRRSRGYQLPTVFEELETADVNPAAVDLDSDIVNAQVVHERNECVDRVQE